MKPRKIGFWQGLFIFLLVEIGVFTYFGIGKETPVQKIQHGLITQAVAEAPAPKTYVVKRGDALWKIAKKHGMDNREEIEAYVAAIRIAEVDKETGAVIGMIDLKNPNLIHPGQILTLPSSSPEKISITENAHPEKIAKAVTRDQHLEPSASTKKKSAHEKISEKTSLLTRCELHWRHTKPQRNETTLDAANRIKRYFEKDVVSASRETGLDPRLIISKLIAESNGYPCARSKTGCRGIAQFTKGTARQLGMPLDRIYDPETGIRYGARLLKGYIDEMGSVPLGLAAYNIGPGNVRWLEKTGWRQSRRVCERNVCYSVDPKAIKAYVRKILDTRGKLEQQDFTLT